MDERRQVMKTMSSKFSCSHRFLKEKKSLLDQLKRPPATLLMNQIDRWRERKELLDLMDATVPLIQNGKNWRLNSEFWTQQQLIGNDDNGIQYELLLTMRLEKYRTILFSTTLTRTEIGLPPAFETIGKPTIGLLETGIDLTTKAPTMKHKRQWFNSE